MSKLPELIDNLILYSPVLYGFLNKTYCATRNFSSRVMSGMYVNSHKKIPPNQDFLVNLAAGED